MNNIPIILLIISLILSLVIYYYINANIIEKFYTLTRNDFNKFSDDFRNLSNIQTVNSDNYYYFKEYHDNTLEPKLLEIINEVDRCNNFEETINSYGFS